LWYYSEQFDNLEWLKTECTITANSVISPDGTQNADKITDTTANSEHRFRATNALFTISTATTFSIFAKAGEYSKFGIADLSYGYIVKFDLSAGTIISTGTDWSNAKIENFGNGWYRLSATRSTNATCGYAMLNDSGDFVFTGTGTKGVYIWGAQVEVSTYPTSYIPTTSASATRVADACLTASVPSLIGQTEGVFFVDFNKISAKANQFFILSNIAGTTAASYFNSIYLFQISDSGFVSDGFVSNVQQFGFTVGSLSVGRHKLAIAYKANDFVLYIDGVLAGTDTSGSLPTMNYLTIGGGGDVGDQSQSVNQVCLFKTRLTNSELASLTTL
jgi:hypothetical protein